MTQTVPPRHTGPSLDTAVAVVRTNRLLVTWLHASTESNSVGITSCDGWSGTIDNHSCSAVLLTCTSEYYILSSPCISPTQHLYIHCIHCILDTLISSIHIIIILLCQCCTNLWHRATATVVSVSAPRWVWRRCGRVAPDIITPR